jgi:hypothetical protein
MSVSIRLPKRPENCFSTPVNTSSIMIVGTVILTVLLTPGCKKDLPPEPGTDTNAATVATDAPAVDDTNAALMATNAPAPVHFRGKDLGVVRLTNRCETQIQVGDGKSCIIKPLLLDPQRVRLTMTLETKLADGKTRGMKIMTVVAKPDEPFEVDFGNLVFALTPQMGTNAVPIP